jgi:hypothetical protein
LADIAELLGELSLQRQRGVALGGSCSCDCAFAVELGKLGSARWRARTAARNSARAAKKPVGLRCEAFI